MTEFKIFEGEEIKDDGEIEPIFKLEKEDGEIKLIVCDKSGNVVDCGYILKIRKDGTLYKYAYINEYIKFIKTDFTGSIKEQ